MDPLESLTIDPTLARTSPHLSLHAMRFEEATIGIGHPGLDTVRARVMARLDAAMSQVSDPAEALPIRAVVRWLDALGQSPDRRPPHILQRVRATLRREPFQVTNDACDAAVLLSLYYLSPVFILDADSLEGPLTFTALAAGAGPPNELWEGAPALCDQQRPLADLQTGRTGAPVTETTNRFLVVIPDLGDPQPLDAERTVQRVENWMTSLTRGRLSGHRVVAQSATS